MANLLATRDRKRRNFLQAGIDAAAEFKRTGIAYPHHEAMRYLRARISGEKAGKPKPFRVPPSER